MAACGPSGPQAAPAQQLLAKVRRLIARQSASAPGNNTGDTVISRPSSSMVTHTHIHAGSSETQGSARASLMAYTAASESRGRPSTIDQSVDARDGHSLPTSNTAAARPRAISSLMALARAALPTGINTAAEHSSNLAALAWAGLPGERRRTCATDDIGEAAPRVVARLSLRVCAWSLESGLDGRTSAFGPCGLAHLARETALAITWSEVRLHLDVKRIASLLTTGATLTSPNRDNTHTLNNPPVQSVAALNPELNTRPRLMCSSREDAEAAPRVAHPPDRTEHAARVPSGCSFHIERGPRVSQSEPPSLLTPLPLSGGEASSSSTVGHSSLPSSSPSPYLNLEQRPSGVAMCREQAGSALPWGGDQPRSVPRAMNAVHRAISLCEGGAVPPHDGVPPRGGVSPLAGLAGLPLHTESSFHLAEASIEADAATEAMPEVAADVEVNADVGGADAPLADARGFHHLCMLVFVTPDGASVWSFLRTGGNVDTAGALCEAGDEGLADARVRACEMVNLPDRLEAAVACLSDTADATSECPSASGCRVIRVWAVVANADLLETIRLSARGAAAGGFEGVRPTRSLVADSPFGEPILAAVCKSLAACAIDITCEPPRTPQSDARGEEEVGTAVHATCADEELDRSDITDSERRRDADTLGVPELLLEGAEAPLVDGSGRLHLSMVVFVVRGGNDVWSFRRLGTAPDTVSALCMASDARLVDARSRALGMVTLPSDLAAATEQLPDLPHATTEHDINARTWVARVWAVVVDVGMSANIELSGWEKARGTSACMCPLRDLVAASPFGEPMLAAVCSALGTCSAVEGVPHTLYFYGHTSGPLKDLSQFARTPFTDRDGVAYSSAEQYMMAAKVSTAGGQQDLLDRIMTAGQEPRVAKHLGRTAVIDVAAWDAVSLDCVVYGNLLKFSQNANLRGLLLATGDHRLAEAAPQDLIWGIGLSIEEAAADEKWRGRNQLGRALMRVREMLRAAPTSPDENEVRLTEAMDTWDAEAASRAETARRKTANRRDKAELRRALRASVKSATPARQCVVVPVDSAESGESSDTEMNGDSITCGGEEPAPKSFFGDVWLRARRDECADDVTCEPPKTPQSDAKGEEEVDTAAQMADTAAQFIRAGKEWERLNLQMDRGLVAVQSAITDIEHKHAVTFLRLAQPRPPLKKMHYLNPNYNPYEMAYAVPEAGTAAQIICADEERELHLVAVRRHVIRADEERGRHLAAVRSAISDGEREHAVTFFGARVFRSWAASCQSRADLSPEHGGRADVPRVRICALNPEGGEPVDLSHVIATINCEKRRRVITRYLVRTNGGDLCDARWRDQESMASLANGAQMIQEWEDGLALAMRSHLPPCTDPKISIGAAGVLSRKRNKELEILTETSTRWQKQGWRPWPCLFSKAGEHLGDSLVASVAIGLSVECHHAGFVCTERSQGARSTDEGGTNGVLMHTFLLHADNDALQRCRAPEGVHWKTIPQIREYIAMRYRTQTWDLTWGRVFSSIAGPQSTRDDATLPLALSRPKRSRVDVPPPSEVGTSSSAAVAAQPDAAGPVDPPITPLPASDSMIQQYYYGTATDNTPALQHIKAIHKHGTLLLCHCPSRGYYYVATRDVAPEAPLFVYGGRLVPVGDVPEEHTRWATNTEGGDAVDGAYVYAYLPPEGHGRLRLPSTHHGALLNKPSSGAHATARLDYVRLRHALLHKLSCTPRLRIIRANSKGIAKGAEVTVWYGSGAFQDHPEGDVVPMEDEAPAHPASPASESSAETEAESEPPVTEVCVPPTVEALLLHTHSPIAKDLLLYTARPRTDDLRFEALACEGKLLWASAEPRNAEGRLQDLCRGSDGKSLNAPARAPYRITLFAKARILSASANFEALCVLCPHLKAIYYKWSGAFVRATNSRKDHVTVSDLASVLVPKGVHAICFDERVGSEEDEYVLLCGAPFLPEACIIKEGEWLSASGSRVASDMEPLSATRSQRQVRPVEYEEGDAEMDAANAPDRAADKAEKSRWGKLAREGDGSQIEYFSNVDNWRCPEAAGTTGLGAYALWSFALPRAGVKQRTMIPWFQTITTEHGLGLQAMHPFKAGQWIGVYVGEIVSSENVERLRASGKGDYILHAANMYLNGLKGWSGLERIDDPLGSERRPNVVAHNIYAVRGKMGCVAMTANHDIEVGDEILLDYGEIFWKSQLSDLSRYGAATRNFELARRSGITGYTVELPSAPRDPVPASGGGGCASAASAAGRRDKRQRVAYSTTVGARLVGFTARPKVDGRLTFASLACDNVLLWAAPEPRLAERYLHQGSLDANGRSRRVTRARYLLFLPTTTRVLSMSKHYTVLRELLPDLAVIYSPLSDHPGRFHRNSERVGDFDVVRDLSRLLVDVDVLVFDCCHNTGVEYVLLPTAEFDAYPCHGKLGGTVWVPLDTQGRELSELSTQAVESYRPSTSRRPPECAAEDEIGPTSAEAGDAATPVITLSDSDDVSGVAPAGGGKHELLGSLRVTEEELSGWTVQRPLPEGMECGPSNGWLVFKSISRDKLLLMMAKTRNCARCYEAFNRKEVYAVASGVDASGVRSVCRVVEVRGNVSVLEQLSPGISAAFDMDSAGCPRVNIHSMVPDILFKLARILAQAKPNIHALMMGAGDNREAMLLRGAAKDKCVYFATDVVECGDEFATNVVGCSGGLATDVVECSDVRVVVGAVKAHAPRASGEECAMRRGRALVAAYEAHCGGILTTALARYTLDTLAGLDLRGGLTFGELFAGMGGRVQGFMLDSPDWRGWCAESESVECGVLRQTSDRVSVVRVVLSERRALPATLQLPVSVLSAGPPCQPYTREGLHGGLRDPRDGMEITLRAIAEAQPVIVEIETVPGILSALHTDDLAHICDELRRLGYAVRVHTVNAADYGVPQRRMRVLIMGSRLGFVVAPPTSGVVVTAGAALSAAAENQVEPLFVPECLTISESQWCEILRGETRSRCAVSRDLHLDRPSRTLTSSNLVHRTANVLRQRMDNGRRRLLTVFEAAVLQALEPSVLEGVSRTRAMRMIGNAHPPPQGKAYSGEYRRQLEFLRTVSSICVARLEYGARVLGEMPRVGSCTAHPLVRGVTGSVASTDGVLARSNPEGMASLLRRLHRSLPGPATDWGLSVIRDAMTPWSICALIEAPQGRLAEPSAEALEAIGCTRVEADLLRGDGRVSLVLERARALALAMASKRMAMTRDETVIAEYAAAYPEHLEEMARTCVPMVPALLTSENLLAPEGDATAWGGGDGMDDSEPPKLVGIDDDSDDDEQGVAQRGEATLNMDVAESTLKQLIADHEKRTAALIAEGDASADGADAVLAALKQVAAPMLAEDYRRDWRDLARKRCEVLRKGARRESKRAGACRVARLVPTTDDKPPAIGDQVRIHGLQHHKCLAFNDREARVVGHTEDGRCICKLRDQQNSINVKPACLALVDRAPRGLVDQASRTATGEVPDSNAFVGNLSPSSYSEGLVGRVTPHVEHVKDHRLPSDSRALEFNDMAYPIHVGDNGLTSLRRLPGALADTGGAITAFDRDTIDMMRREGAVDTVLDIPEEEQFPLNLAPVGGGPVNVVGEAWVLVCIKDMITERWHRFRLRAYVITGPPLVLIGNTFMVPTDAEARPRRGTLSLIADSVTEERICTSVSASGGYEQSELYSVNSVRSGAPMIYSNAETVIKPRERVPLEVRMPEFFAGHDVLTVGLDAEKDKGLFFQQSRLTIAEAAYDVRPGGYATVQVTNPTDVPIRLAAHSQVGYVLADPDVAALAPSDMTIDEIVDSLHIHESVNASPEEVAKAKEQVKQMLNDSPYRRSHFSTQRLGRCTAGEFEVELLPEYRDGTKPPPAEAARPLPAAQQKAARAICDDMVSQGVLQPTDSPFAAPILMVKKPKGGWRLVCDFRRTNAALVKQHYPLPRINDVLSKMARGKFFTCVDMISAFWQLAAGKEAVRVTAVQFPWGRYSWQVMPMGMQAASASFQRTMDKLLMGLDCCAVSYIDDVCVWSETWEQHLLDVASVLDRLGGAGLVLRPSKCFIGCPSVQALGHIVSADGIKPDPARVKSFVDAGFPEEVEELQHYVGLIQWFSKHIPGCSMILQPLRDRLNRKDRGAPSSAEREAFDRLNTELTTEDGNLLMRPDFEKPFFIGTDASQRKGGGAWLAQRDDNDALRPIAWYSRCWAGPERHWAPIVQECAVIYRAIMEFERYVGGTHFTLGIDAEPLCWLQSVKRPSGKLAAWVMALQGFEFTTKHIPGHLNTVADCLSRLATVLGALQGRRRCPERAQRTMALGVVRERQDEVSHALAREVAPSRAIMALAPTPVVLACESTTTMQVASMITREGPDGQCQVLLARTEQSAGLWDLLRGDARHGATEETASMVLESALGAERRGSSQATMVMGNGNEHVWWFGDALDAPPHVRRDKPSQSLGWVCVEPDSTLRGARQDLSSGALRAIKAMTRALGVSTLVDRSRPVMAVRSRPADRSTALLGRETSCGMVLFNANCVLAVRGRGLKGEVLRLPALRKDQRKGNRQALSVRALATALGVEEVECAQLVQPVTHFIVARRSDSVVHHLCTPCPTARLRALLPSGLPSGVTWVDYRRVSFASFANWADQGVVRRLAAMSRAMAQHVPMRTHPALMLTCQDLVRATLAPLQALRRATDCVVPSGMLSKRAEVVQALRDVQDAIAKSSPLTPAVRQESGCRAILSVDLEFERLSKYTKSRVIMLLQVRVGAVCAVFDTYIFPDVLRLDNIDGVPTMRHWLEREDVVVILHDAGSDVMVLQADYQIRMRGLFDTAIADALAQGRGHHRRQNLGVVMDRYVPTHGMEHKGTLTFVPGLFRKRPLPQYLIEYAYQDVMWGLELFQNLRDALIRQGALDAVYVRSRIVADRLHSCGKRVPVRRIGIIMTNGVDALINATGGLVLAATVDAGRVNTRWSHTVEAAFPSIPMCAPAALSRIRTRVGQTLEMKPNTLTRAWQRGFRVDATQYFYVFVDNLDTAVRMWARRHSTRLRRVGLKQTDAWPCSPALSTTDSDALALIRHRFDLPMDSPEGDASVGGGGEPGAGGEPGTGVSPGVITETTTKIARLVSVASAGTTSLNFSAFRSTARHTTVRVVIATNTRFILGPNGTLPEVVLSNDTRRVSDEVWDGLGPNWGILAKRNEVTLERLQLRGGINYMAVRGVSEVTLSELERQSEGSSLESDEVALERVEKLPTSADAPHAMARCDRDALDEALSGREVRDRDAVLVRCDRDRMDLAEMVGLVAVHAAYQSVVGAAVDKRQVVNLATLQKPAYGSFVQPDAEPIEADALGAVAVLIHDGERVVLVEIGEPLQRDQRKGFTWMLPTMANERAGEGVRNYYRAQQVVRCGIGALAFSSNPELRRVERGLELMGALPRSTKAKLLKQHVGAYAGVYGLRLECSLAECEDELQALFADRDNTPTAIAQHPRMRIASLAEVVGELPDLDEYACGAILDGGPSLRRAECCRVAVVDSFRFISNIGEEVGKRVTFFWDANAARRTSSED